MKPKKTVKMVEQRVRFNWGYHDGASAVRNNFPRLWTTHYDKAYEAGYWLGKRDQQEGTYAENSDAAWSEHKAGKVAV